MLWLGVAYLGALAALFITALWTQNGFTGLIERNWTLDNFQTLFTVDVYRTIALRTIGVALLVTVIDALVAFPIALYMSKVAGPGLRRFLLVAVLMPLWASYLVKAYAWRGMFSEGGLVSSAFEAGRAEVARLRSRGDRGDAGVSVVAVHGPADLRRSRTAAGLTARGVRRSRAAGPPRHCGG